MKSKVAIIEAGISGLCIGALLSEKKIPVIIHEKMNKLGGRTATTIYKNHILDNGFHVIPFYKKSFSFEVLRRIKIEPRVNIAKVSDIQFYADKSSTNTQREYSIF